MPKGWQVAAAAHATSPSRLFNSQAQKLLPFITLMDDKFAIQTLAFHPKNCTFMFVLLPADWLTRFMIDNINNDFPAQAALLPSRIPHF